MEALRNGIELTGTLYTSAQGDAKDKLAYAEQIWDDEQQKHQSEINKQLAKGIEDVPVVDEEDITVTADNKIQLKDRDSSKGMGYKILRLPEDGILMLNMVNEPNTIYEIRYDFDLNGQTITIPENCVLKFEGGKLGNGTITGNQNTTIKTQSHCFGIDLVVSQGFDIGYLIPQNFGAVADGVFDCSEIFKVLEDTPYDIKIPKGVYVVNNLNIKKSKKWEFETSSNNHWFDSGNARLKTSTGVVISGGPSIYNICVLYGGTESDLSKRGPGLHLISHWCEIHGAWIGYFNIGILLGGTAHCDYTRLYNINCWYNYFSGISVEHSSSSLVNFITFTDVNTGSNGVSVHDQNVEPNIERGYGFYFHGGNSIYINNADVSSNETAGICIDNLSTLYANRGLSISTLYAENNKFCNILYKNNINGSLCRTLFVDINNAYFSNDASLFFKHDVYANYPYIPPTVKLLDSKLDIIKDTNSLESLYYYGESEQQKKLSSVFVIPENDYEIRLLLKAKSSGNITFLNTFDKFSISPFTPTRVGTNPAFNIPVIEGEISEHFIYIKAPQSEEKLLLYNASTYGASYEIVDYHITNITKTLKSSKKYGMIPNGYLALDSSTNRLVLWDGTKWIDPVAEAVSWKIIR